ncbi:hypothetical protein [Streptomyces sp. t39]|uniref:hypothetical protein n=1 Tax=Streptomyces sp. t39 TaxID=1828156 RepID=UPI0011CDBFC3|nr:hypothetical protein [Streptomyces sp. t39]TXS58271.1 hypothetical protein EAO77_00020 [Streptomyces sp. t39]
MPGAEEAVDDDALYVLTAVLLTPAQFPGVLGDDYPQACRALALEPYAEGYGLVIGQDAQGARWTVVIDDVSLVAVAIASWDCGMEYDLSPDENSVVAALPGWPLELAVAAPGVPAPHDPAPEEGDRPPLTPPDTEEWGPAQRRMGADEVAQQWAQWREGTGQDAAAEPDGGAAPTAPVADGGGSEDEDRLAEGLRRALREARAYADAVPPPGRVRSAFAPGGARTIRADGPGWSLVARTDDMAFVLLDEEPCEVIPVERGPELESLLDVLVKVAVHPS